jgi:hypothetical protein
VLKSRRFYLDAQPVTGFQLNHFAQAVYYFVIDLKGYAEKMAF